VFYPSSDRKFRCNDDYYWASVFQVRLCTVPALTWSHRKKHFKKCCESLRLAKVFALFNRLATVVSQFSYSSPLDLGCTGLIDVFDTHQILNNNDKLEGLLAH
jgi:hypothetical protein